MTFEKYVIYMGFSQEQADDLRADFARFPEEERLQAKGHRVGKQVETLVVTNPYFVPEKNQWG